MGYPKKDGNLTSSMKMSPFRVKYGCFKHKFGSRGPKKDGIQSIDGVLTSLVIPHSKGKTINFYELNAKFGNYSRQG